jgi:hypothetical protein
VACQVIVVKDAMHAKASGLLGNPYYIADAFDSQFRITLIRRGKKHFDPNTGPDGWAFATEDQCSVQCNIVSEPSLSMFITVVPVENNREPKPVSNCGSTLHRVTIDRDEVHTWAQSSVRASESQVTSRLKIQESEVRTV